MGFETFLLHHGKEFTVTDLLAIERNYFAAERTFLSWLRTGLTAVGGGFAFFRFLQFENPTHQFLATIVAFVLVLWGIAIFWLALSEYQDECRRLQKLLGHTIPIWKRQCLVGVLFFLSLIVLILMTA